MTLRTAMIATTFAAVAVSTPASAQDIAADPAMTSEPADNDDDSGKWGLLGLLGLAGLMGLKRRDRDDHRGTTGTNTTR